MEDATFRLNMVYTLAAGTAQRPFAAAPVAVCNRRMQVLEYISRLHCPKEQKLALIDAILEQIREDNRKEKEGESLSP